MNIFTPEELAEIAAADAEIEREFKLTHQELVESEARDKAALKDKSYMERRRAQSKAYYWKNREKRLAYQKKYRAAHIEEARAYHRAYYAAHRQEACAYRAAYEKAHADKRREWQRIYRERRKQRKQDHKGGSE